MGKWHWSFDMNSLQEKVGWGKYRDITLWQVVLRDVDYIRWIAQNSDIYISPTLAEFLTGALDCENIEKKQTYFMAAYEMLSDKEQKIRNDVKRKERKKLREERKRKDRKLEEEKRKKKEEDKFHMQLSDFLKDIKQLIILAQQKELCWEKQKGFYDGNMRREKYSCLYNSKVITLHKDSYRGKEYKWISSYYFSYESENKRCEIKETNIVWLWEYLEKVEQEKNKHLLEEKKKKLEEEADKIANMPRKEVEFVDVVVKCHTLACDNNHHVEDVVAVFMVAKNGIIREVEVPAGYCNECECYFILEETYKTIQGKGVLLCQLLSEVTFWKIKKGQYDQTDTWADESPLKIAGYNVDSKKNLSIYERRMILEYIIDSKILTKHRVLSYLDYFIEYRKNMEHMQQAVDKWREDRKYIANYELGSKKHVKVGTLTRKIRIHYS